MRGFVCECADGPDDGRRDGELGDAGGYYSAEPHALIGFAGPRVIEQTIGQKLPKGFQRAEFLVEHGFVDRILPREEAKEVLSEILRSMGKISKFPRKC